MKIKKISGGLKFLLLMILIYIILAFFNLDFVIGLGVELLKNLGSIIPILLIVYLFMFLINIFINPEMIKKHLGQGSGIRGWFYSIIAGILIPAPPYIIMPMLSELKKQGMKNSLIVSFLYNRNLQITFLPVMTYYFGLAFTVVISIYVFIFAIISGLVMGRMDLD